MTVQALNEYARRSKRAAEADGLNDVLGGVLLIAITGMQYAGTRAQATIQGHRFWETQTFQVGHLLWLLSILTTFAAIFLGRRVVGALRERFVYPRLGYVAPSMGPDIRRKGIQLLFAVVTMLFVGLVSKLLIPIRNHETVLLVVGVVGAIGYLAHFTKLGFIRHLVLGCLSVLLSLVVPAGIKDDLTAIGGFALLMGFASITAGSVAFSHLLQAPLIQDEADKEVDTP